MVVVCGGGSSGGWGGVGVCPGAYRLGGHSFRVEKVLHPTVCQAVEPFSSSTNVTSLT